ncbi:pirin family protein [Arenibaculum pallidiluteum]|uniref:pirin family protein n=1 Tax=Arenibaculum pallidiluteum TaxID=2812559 RepID=UPI001A962DBD|nr:pirin family protein [Arenibaculum pallidiluteum]
MTARPVVRIHAAERDDIAELVTRRPLPGPSLALLDPFLLLNHHGPQSYPPGNRGLPFGPHPHRGFETVTFILEGELAHQDSGGHESVIGSGGVQWMTAGSGLIHAELSPESFRRGGGPLEILQLWVNLPARLKMTEPRYVGLQRDQIPAIEEDGGRVRVNLVSAAYDGREGPVRSPTDVQMLWVEAAAGGRFAMPVAPGRTVLLYVVRGAVEVGTRRIDAFELAELGEGDTVAFEAAADSLVLLGHGQPFGEPVVAHGPFVMNTQAEIAQAVQDYRAGRFGSWAGA